MASYFDPIDVSLFNLGDLSTFQSRDITEAIIDFSVSLSSEQSSQIAVTALDPSFTFAKANYFQVRRDIFYRNLWFEISAVSTQRSSALFPEYQIECRSKAIQLMKRDKRPEAYRGMSAYEFAFTIAQRFGMNFVGEQTTKKPAVVKGKTRNSDDSVWTVLRSLASEQQFICFESENTLFFCSEKFLLGKWGDPNYAYGDFKFVPFFYPDSDDPVWVAAQQKYILLEQPSLRRSDDDIHAASGSMLVDRYNGVNLRPGMTIFLGGIPDFESFYLITEVTFNEGSNEPVQVQFRLPVDPDKETISTSTSQGSSPNGGKRGNNKIGDAPGDGSTQIPRDEPLSASGARSYATEALRRIGYRGSNANLIRSAVADAIPPLLGQTTADASQRTIESLKKRIRNNTRLSELERDYAESIFIAYVTNKPVASLGVAGGLSRASVNEMADYAARKFQAVESNPTPLLRSSASTTRSLSSASANSIEQYIRSKAAQRTGIDEAITATKTAARRILNLGTLSLKQAEFKRLEKAWQTTQLDRTKYASLTQASVLNEIASGWDNKNAGGWNTLQIRLG